MGRSVLAAAAAAAVLALVLVGVGSGLIVDAIWFRHLGYSVVFRTMIGARIACFAREQAERFLRRRERIDKGPMLLRHRPMLTCILLPRS